MSWFANALITDNDAVDKLREIVDNNNANCTPPPSDSMKEQQEFALNVVAQAFDESVLDEGAYNVSISGHSNPDQENDRKSLGISFSPATTPVESVE